MTAQTRVRLGRMCSEYSEICIMIFRDVFLFFVIFLNYFFGEPYRPPYKTAIETRVQHEIVGRQILIVSPDSIPSTSCSRTNLATVVEQKQPLRSQNGLLLSVLALIVSQYGKQFEKLKRPHGAKLARIFLFW